MFLQDDRAIQVPIEQWLMNQGVMCKEYLCCIVNRKSVIDGLFFVAISSCLSTAFEYLASKGYLDLEKIRNHGAYRCYYHPCSGMLFAISENGMFLYQGYQLLHQASS